MTCRCRSQRCLPERINDMRVPAAGLFVACVLLLGRRRGCARVHARGRDRRASLGARDARRRQGRGRVPRDQGGGRQRRPPGRGAQPDRPARQRCTITSWRTASPACAASMPSRAGGKSIVLKPGGYHVMLDRPEGAAEGRRSPQAHPGVREGGRDRGGGDRGADRRHGPARFRPPAWPAAREDRRAQALSGCDAASGPDLES